ARDDQVDALARADLELAPLPRERLGLVGPDTGGVDDLTGADVDLATGLEVLHPGADDPVALTQQVDHACAAGDVGTVRGRGARQEHRVAGIVDLAVVV